MSNVRFQAVRIPSEREKLIQRAGYKTGLLIASYVFAQFYEEVDEADVQEFIKKCDELLAFVENHVDSWKDMNTFLKDYTGRDIVYEG